MQHKTTHVHSQRGVSIVEMSIVLPLILALFLAFLQFALVISQRAAIELALDDVARSLQRTGNVCEKINAVALADESEGSIRSQIYASSGIVFLAPRLGPNLVQAVPCYWDSGADDPSLMTGLRQIKLRITYGIPCFACSFFTLGLVPGTIAFTHTAPVIPEQITAGDWCLYDIGEPICQNV